jgi:hypothetical protein
VTSMSVKCTIRTQYAILFIKDRNVTGKAVPVTGRGGPYGGVISRLPHFLHIRFIDDGGVVSLTRRPAAIYPPGRFLMLVCVKCRVDPGP